MISPVVYWRTQPKLKQHLGKTGKIISSTLIRTAPANFSDQVPYPVAIVEFPDGSKITAQVVDYQPQQLHPGQKVVCVVRRLFQPESEEVISYGLKVKPV